MTDNEKARQARRTPHAYEPTGQHLHHRSPLCGVCGLAQGNQVHAEKTAGRYECPDHFVPQPDTCAACREGVDPQTGQRAPGCYRCQLGDPHTVHETSEEVFGIAEQDVLHVVCHDPNTALCGADVSGEPWRTGETTCQVCAIADANLLPCATCVAMAPPHRWEAKR